MGGGSHSPDGDGVTTDDGLASDVRQVHVEYRASEGVNHHLGVVDVVVNVRWLSYHALLPHLAFQEPIIGARPKQIIDY